MAETPGADSATIVDVAANLAAIKQEIAETKAHSLTARPRLRPSIGVRVCTGARAQLGRELYVEDVGGQDASQPGDGARRRRLAVLVHEHVEVEHALVGALAQA